ncbi:TetR/AcrR family transcriptional regulator [Actinoplanes friuliensis]|uniref:TetR family transcriptional regulator n=1 Tax=Actinoplanes friuliensis DSM 7358 TaxID=1246995 RepID=U5VSS2_9ACTN|nr:TetR/AcrR family transcriptional regulator [Actinoplanes friuliensis]AGZ38765.1 TetR family transcriptional regulator [Actinoplanes friuliensis DSM 7358]
MTSALRGHAREEAILAAAVELVAEIGYDRVSMDAIAARARASKATIYRKWPGKAPLIAEAVRRTAEAVPPQATNTGTVRGDLLASVAAITRALTGHTGPSIIGLTQALREDRTLRDLVRAQIADRSIAQGALIAGSAAGRGEQVDAARVARVLDLAVAQLFLTTLLGGAPPTTADQSALVDEVLLPLLSHGGPGQPHRARVRDA